MTGIDINEHIYNSVVASFSKRSDLGINIACSPKVSHKVWNLLIMSILMKIDSITDVRLEHVVNEHVNKYEWN